MNGPINGNGGDRLLQSGLHDLRWQFKQLHGSQRSSIFLLAVGITAVSAKTVAVVTSFRCCIDNSVSAASKTAIEATKGVGNIFILESEITLLSGVLHAIAAQGGEIAAGRRAPVRQAHIMRGGLALFAKERLHRSVSTRTALQKTVSTAAIEVPDIAVLTFFTRLHDAVAADGSVGKHRRAVSDERAPDRQRQSRLHQGSRCGLNEGSEGRLRQR